MDYVETALSEIRYTNPCAYNILKSFYEENKPHCKLTEDLVYIGGTMMFRQNRDRSVKITVEGWDIGKMFTDTVLNEKEVTPLQGNFKAGSDYVDLNDMFIAKCSSNKVVFLSEKVSK